MKRLLSIFALLALILAPSAAYPQSIGGGYLGQSSTFPNVTIAQTLGTELLTNGAFATDTWWDKGTGWTIAAGVATFSGATAGNLTSGSITIVNGATYHVTYTITAFSAGQISVSVGGVNGQKRNYEGGAYTFEEDITTTGTAGLIFACKGDSSVSIDDVSLKRSFAGVDASSGGANGSGYYLYFNANNYWKQGRFRTHNSWNGNAFEAPNLINTLDLGAFTAWTQGETWSPFFMSPDLSNISTGIIAYDNTPIVNTFILIGGYNARPLGGDSGVWRAVTFPTANKDYVNATGIGAAGVASVGSAIHVIGGTSATAGVYKVTTVVSANSVQVDRNIHASGTDITDGIVRVQTNFIGFFPHEDDITNGIRMAAYHNADKPLIIGGNTAPATGHSLTSTDVLFAGKTEFDGLAYFDSTVTIGTSNLTGITFASLGTATIGIDMTSSGLSGSDDKWIAFDANNYFRADGRLWVSAAIYSGTYISSDSTNSINLRTTGVNIGVDIQAFTTQPTGIQLKTLSPLLMGVTASTVGSLTGCTSNGTTTITKTDHGLTLAAGELVYVTGATTAADKGFYRIVSSTVSTIVVDRALSGSDSDVALTVYKDMVALMAADSNGQGLRAFGGTANKPLQLGGTVNASTTTLASEDVYIAGDIGFSTETANGAVATAISNVGPTGAQTTIQGWIKIIDSGGTARYIPYW